MLIYITMASTDIQYITWDNYIDKQNNQNSLLKEEFGKIHTYNNSVDTRLNKLDADVAVLKKDITVLKDNRAELKVNFL
jgi:septal ring factor EnvC (AmiA/AmiB activator)